MIRKQSVCICNAFSPCPRLIGVNDIWHKLNGEYAPADHRAKDGVHPSSAGASLMAQVWVQTVG